MGEISASRRKLILGASGLGTAATFGMPSLVRAVGEQPIKIGMVNPLTGGYSALAINEVNGAKYATELINKAGGIMGRPVELLIEDSNLNVGVGVQKARKLIERDKVSVLLGDMNSGVAYAITQVSNELKTPQIVLGALTDPITGQDCKWNVFRIIQNTRMQANAICDILIQKFGKRWYFLTPDYAYGHSVQANFQKKLADAGGTVVGSDLVPVGTPDFSAYLIKARAAKPDVFISFMGGNDAPNLIRQFIQFGLHKEIPLAGASQDLEALRSLPPEARIGWWAFSWYWKQPGVPGVNEFNDAIKARFGGADATARHWFGYAAMNTIAGVMNEIKTTDPLKFARALEGWTLPPEIALQPGKISFRPGDHQLMSTTYVGEAIAGTKESPDDLFKISSLVPGEQAAGPVAQSGCKLVYPA